MNKLNPSQSILKNYLKEPVRIEDINLFRDSLKRLLNEINEDETEEFNKNLVIHFLRNSLYSDRHFLVNTYGRTDLAIYVDAATQEEHPVVLFEVKGPSRPDMVSHDNMNKKAMHELVLYYLIEEVEKKNNDIKHLIITDCRQFFIFEKKEFFRLFAKNKSFVKRVIDAYKQGNDTSYIYSRIIAPEVERKQSMLHYTYIDFNTFKKDIVKDDIIKSHKFIAAYKLFSPVNLLNLPFASDHNTLNNNFYRELLYCLFGVDLNPKSVDICQLRLWIELLKNSYYYHSEDGTRQLQTLPNIDINIKCGNSLASHKPVTIGKKVQPGINITNDISDYKKLVADYKASKSKTSKKDIFKKIDVIKRKLNHCGDPLDLFIDQTEDIAVYRTMSKSLEWMMEFPEILGDDGTLIGFDVIIGNPPYISLEKLTKDVITYKKMKRLDENNHEVKNYRTLMSRGDIYLLFVERRLRPFLQGRGLTAFGKAIAGSHLLYIPKGFTLNGMGIDLEKQEKPDEAEAWEWFSQNYPAVSEWMSQFAKDARGRTDKGDYWWELRACAYYDKFESPKIFYQVFQTKPCFVYDKESTFCNNSMYFLPTSDKALLAFLNSSTGWWLISEFCPRIQGGYQLIWDNFSQIPIPSQLPSEWEESADALMDAIADNDLETFTVKKAALDKQIADKYDSLLQS